MKVDPRVAARMLNCSRFTVLRDVDETLIDSPTPEHVKYIRRALGRRAVRRLLVIASLFSDKALAEALRDRVPAERIRFLGEVLDAVGQQMVKATTARRCETCGRELFASTRAHARYCSAKCRQKHFQARRRSGKRNNDNASEPGIGSTSVSSKRAIEKVSQ